MAGLRANGLASSLPPPRPKSPPEHPDLYWKRREFAKVKVLEREIGFLEEELKSVEGLQPASRSCKEVAEFVLCSEDPLIPLTKNIPRPCGLSKWLCCMSHVEKQNCTTCSCSNLWKSCKCSSCFNTCSSSRCIPKCHSCLSCPSIRCTCFPKCSEVNICPCCNNSCCCYSRCISY